MNGAAHRRFTVGTREAARGEADEDVGKSTAISCRHGCSQTAYDKNRLDDVLRAPAEHR
jgi:hypothetical protein